MARKTTAKKAKNSSKSKKTTKRRTSKKNKPSFLKSALKWLFVLGLWCGIALTGVLAWYGQELPEIAKTIAFQKKNAITVKAADGSIIARYGDIQGENFGVEDMPPHLVHAVLAIEDRRFYHHFGIDPLGIARAMVVNAREKRFVQGGSTITQQLAKNLFLSRERTLKRKIQEAMLALWLEYELTKDEILGAYLNRVYFGAGTYGVDAASQVYFGKPVTDIDLEQAATLAGLLKAPSKYSPTNNPALARQRAQVVMNAMVDAGYISSQTQDKITGDTPRPPRKPGAPKDNARYFADWVVDGLDELIGTPSEDIIVETTLNPRIQSYAQAALIGTLQSNGIEHHITQGAVVVMRPDGQVVAMLGGKDYSESQFNRSTQAKRQPGSSFKPIVYLTALENGFTPDTLVMDEPVTTGRYRPKNFGNQYYGEITVSDALTLSLNTVAVQLMRESGRQNVLDMAARLGINTPIKDDLSVALGSSEISPLELATAYATLAAGGVQAKPYAVTRIVSEKGELYFQRPQYNQRSRTVDGEYVYHLTQMMKRVIEEGTGRGAALPVPAAGKTGTSQNSRDAWFAGFTDQLVGVVWLGNDDNTPMKRVTGGSFPARIWQSFMNRSRGQYASLPDNYLNIDSKFSFPKSSFGNLLERLFSQTPGPNGVQVERSGQGAYIPTQPETHHDNSRYND